MRILLIHNDNLNYNLIDSFEEEDKLNFSIPNQALLNPNFSFDATAYEQLSDHFETNGNYDLIVLPYNLSLSNYLEFSGIQVAMQIRLSIDLGHSRTPILFLGSEKPDEIATIVKSDILFTKGVFHSQIQNRSEIDQVAKKIAELNFIISEKDFYSIINKIVINAPNNFDTKHSVDNELALFLWSKKIGLDLKGIWKNIETGIYFKWWILKNKININNSAESKISLKTYDKKNKILIIDDEAEKGWYLYFKSLFRGANVDYLKGDFRNPNSFEENNNIIISALEKIKSFDPDVVLIDLRLTDKDKVRSNESLTGVNILKEFRKNINQDLNQGIRFISISASTKIWHYEELLKNGVNDFIVKLPEVDLDNSILNQEKKIKFKLDEAQYLKKIYLDLQHLKNCLNKSVEENDFEVLNQKLTLTFELICLGYRDSAKNNFAFHVLYMILEGFIKSTKVFKHEIHVSKVVVLDKEIIVRQLTKTNEKEVEFTSINFFTKHKNQFDLETRKYKKSPIFLETFFIVNCLLHLRLGLTYGDKRFKEWSNLNKKRNTITGHGSNELQKDIEPTEILDFVTFLAFLFDNENQNFKNVQLYEKQFDLDSDRKNFTS